MAQSVNSHLVQAAGSSSVGGVDVLVCAICDTGQLGLFGGGVVVGGQALAGFLLDVTGQVNGGIIQQLHLVADLGVDVVMAGLGVHHQIQDVLLCSIDFRHCIDLLEGCVAGLGNSGVDSSHHLLAGLEGAVVVQLAGLGGHGDVDRLIRINRLRSAVHLDTLDFIGLCADTFQSGDAGVQCIGGGLGLCGQILQSGQTDESVCIVSHNKNLFFFLVL